MFSMITSLHIEFNEFKGNVISSWWVSSADPQFNVISCCIGQVLCKPWRVVELTACAGGCTLVTHVTCDRYFYTKLGPLYSAHMGLSIHAKN